MTATTERLNTKYSIAALSPSPFARACKHSIHHTSDSHTSYSPVAVLLLLFGKSWSNRHSQKNIELQTQRKSHAAKNAVQNRVPCKASICAQLRCSHPWRGWRASPPFLFEAACEHSTLGTAYGIFLVFSFFSLLILSCDFMVLF